MSIDKNIFGIIFVLAFGFTLFLLFRSTRSRTRSQVCIVCKKPKFFQISNGREVNSYCYSHGFEYYSKEFLNFKHNLIVDEFNPLRGKEHFVGYSFFPISEASIYESKEGTITKKLIDSIQGQKCSSCSESADVLFYHHGLSPFDKDSELIPISSREPNLDKGIFLCRKHALEKMLDSLEKNSQLILESEIELRVPYKEIGAITTI